MKWIIYKHTAPNGKCYIGQTCASLKERTGKNGIRYKRKNSFFYNAIKKYGWQNFTHEILEENINSQEKANKREMFWIKYYHSYVNDKQSNGYNLTKGGSDNTHQGTPVYCVELKRTFYSAGEAHRITKADKGDILKCCKREKITCGGYHWCFEKDKERFYAIKPKHNLRKIYCVQNKKTYDNSRKVAKDLNVDYSSVLKCCKKKLLSIKGYNFCFEEEKESFVLKEHKTHKRKVICVETNKVFESLQSAAKFAKTRNGNIWRSCNNTRFKAGGYHWKYYEKRKGE